MLVIGFNLDIKLDSDVSDAVRGSADCDSDEESDLELHARVCGDENLETGGSG